MLAPGLSVWAKFVTVPDDASVVEVVGQQWAWSYRFPGSDGELGAVDNKLVTLDNPFGIDPKDPKGQDDILVAHPGAASADRQAGEAGAAREGREPPFAVPQFRVKMDMVPGMVTYFWFTPTAHRRLRRALRAALRRGALRDARPRHRRRRAGVPDLARRATDVRQDRRARQRRRRSGQGDVRDLHGVPRRRRPRATRS